MHMKHSEPSLGGRASSRAKVFVFWCSKERNSLSKGTCANFGPKHSGHTLAFTVSCLTGGGSSKPKFRYAPLINKICLALSLPQLAIS